MKLTEIIMGMPVAIEVLDEINGEEIEEILQYFHEIDELFSPYKKGSEITKINSKNIQLDELNPLVRKVLRLCDETKKLTNGYFDIQVEDHIDPSGLVKGYAMWEGSQKLIKKGKKNFYIEIGGDIDIRGYKNGQKWKVGIPNPLKPKAPKAVLHLTEVGLATSGITTNGLQVYNPIKKKIITDILALTVIGPNIFEADRFSTGAFAMGVQKGLEFIEELKGFEAILFTKDGQGLATSGINTYLE